jgi:hypothetical protein
VSGFVGFLRENFEGSFGFLLFNSPGSNDRDRGAAHQHQCSSDYSLVIWYFANASFGDHNSSTRLNVKRAISDDAASGRHENSNDEYKSFQEFTCRMSNT